MSNVVEPGPTRVCEIFCLESRPEMGETLPRRDAGIPRIAAAPTTSGGLEKGRATEAPPPSR